MRDIGTIWVKFFFSKVLINNFLLNPLGKIQAFGYFHFMYLLSPSAVYLLEAIYLLLLSISLFFLYEEKNTQNNKLIWGLLIFCIPFIGSIAKIIGSVARKNGAPY